MALKPVLKALDGMSDAEKALYKQSQDGTFVLDVESIDGWELTQVSGLKSALEKERKAVGDLTKRVDAFKGLDPTQVRETLDAYEKLKAADPEKKAEQIAAAQIKEVTNKVQAQLSEKDKRASALESQLSKVLIDNAAMDAISKAKGSVSLLLPHVTRQIRMRETDQGTFIAEVVDAQGNPRVGDAHGSPMTIVQLVDEFRNSQEFARAFDASGSSGSGAQPKPGNSREGVPPSNRGVPQAVNVGNGVLRVDAEALAGPKK